MRERPRRAVGARVVSIRGNRADGASIISDERRIIIDERAL
jgi:hypothetical protein